MSLLGFSCNVMSMGDPSKTKEKEPKDEPFLRLTLVDAGQSKSQPTEPKNREKGPLAIATEIAFMGVMYGQSSDEAMAQVEKVQAGCVDLVMHSYNKQFDTIARAVCKDHGIQDGNWLLVREGARAPKDSAHALMFKKFILLNEAMQKVISRKKILTEQEQVEILDMYENIKPIDINRLETILKPHKQ